MKLNYLVTSETSEVKDGRVVISFTQTYDKPLVDVLRAIGEFDDAYNSMCKVDHPLKELILRDHLVFEDLKSLHKAKADYTNEVLRVAFDVNDACLKYSDGDILLCGDLGVFPFMKGKVLSIHKEGGNNEVEVHSLILESEFDIAEFERYISEIIADKDVASILIKEIVPTYTLINTFSKTIPINTSYLSVLKRLREFFILGNDAYVNKYGKVRFKTYIIYDNKAEHYKIGRAKSPHERLKQLGTGNTSLDMLYVCEKDVESTLHGMFASKRISGEWFNLNSNDIETILSKYSFVKVK